MEKNENGLSDFNFSNSSRLNCRGEKAEEREEKGVMENRNDDVHGCSGMPLAMVYSPYQCFRMLYSHDNALKHGTLFEELDKPLREEK